ncbi:MAG: OsmC family protein [Clostridia bacterium]|nr:OsmC family protein [Clostridia bacterium]
MAKVTYKATSRKLGQGMAVESKARNFTVRLDEPKNLGGTDTGMNPVEMVLCALGACQTIVASAFAPNHGIDLKDFWVELEGDLDSDGFTGKSDVRPGFLEIRYKMHFDTTSPQEKVKEFAKFIESHCPVGDTVANPVKVVCSGVVVENN